MRRHSPRRLTPPRRSSSGRRRSLSPRRSKEAPTSLLVRNLSRDTRPDDLRAPFERFGAIKDVYLPKDYHSGAPRGFGFIQFINHRDAIEAQYEMNHKMVNGSEISVVFAEENRKKPAEMRLKAGSRGRERTFRGHSRSRSRSPRRYSPSPRRSHFSRSYSPPYRRAYDHAYYPSPRGRDHYFRSPTPPPYRREQFPIHIRDAQDIPPSYPHFIPGGVPPHFGVLNHDPILRPLQHGMPAGRIWNP